MSAQVLAEQGRLDVLVNKAGITGFEQGAALHDPENARLADWQGVHRTNLDGGLLAGSAATPSVVEE